MDTFAQGSNRHAMNACGCCDTKFKVKSVAKKKQMEKLNSFHANYKKLASIERGAQIAAVLFVACCYCCCCCVSCHALTGHTGHHHSHHGRYGHDYDLRESLYGEGGFAQVSALSGFSPGIPFGMSFALSRSQTGGVETSRRGSEGTVEAANDVHLEETESIGNGIQREGNAVFLARRLQEITTRPTQSSLETDASKTEQLQAVQNTVDHEHDHEHDHDDHDEEEHHHHSNNILGHQLGALALILAVGCFGCFMPFGLRRLHADAILDFANCFAAGAFIGLALFHLLPEAILMTDTARVGINVGKSWYNLTYVLSFCGYIIVLFFEKILYIPGVEDEHGHKRISDHRHHHPNGVCAAVPERSTIETEVGVGGQLASEDHRRERSLNDDEPAGEASASQADVSLEERSSNTSQIKTWKRNVAERLQLTAFSAALALSVHSVFEGMVVGVVSDAMTVWVATISIVGHKWAAGFALASNCVQQNTSLKASLVFLTMFVLASPVGVAIGIPIKNTSVALAGIFNALSLGTILYVGTEMVNGVFERQESPLLRLLRFGLLLVGAGVVFGLMMVHLAFAGHTHGASCTTNAVAHVH